MHSTDLLFAKAMLLLVGALLVVHVQCASKSKPHPHQGVLRAYDNKHIAYNISVEQNKKLNAGEPVYMTLKEKVGKSGRGIVIQDVHAPPSICLDRISDLRNYPKMVPNVKSIDIYSEQTFPNGTVQTGATFKVGISFVTFTYYLKLTYEPKYQTYTWTLDYPHSSDFDDNTGHWQTMPHPTKAGWTRVLYSTEVKLYSWIPEFVVTFLTKTALTESTAWVKRESEKFFKLHEDEPIAPSPLPDLTPCFIENEYGARYDTHCIHPVDAPETEDASEAEAKIVETVAGVAGESKGEL